MQQHPPPRSPPVDDAQVVKSPEDISWYAHADLVVVGFGAAGVSAALEARERGLEVIALDTARGGGATMLSGGVYYAGGGTRIQRDCGEQDSPEAMFEYLKQETGTVVSDETLRRFCEQSASTLDWLIRHGVQFSGPVWKEKTSYPGAGYFLYHSDNSLLSAFAGRHPPAARGHRGVTRSRRAAVNLGGSIFEPLKQSAMRMGVRLDRYSEVRQLLTVPDGRVIGLRAWCLPERGRALKRYVRHLKWAERLLRFYPPVLPGRRWMGRFAGRLYRRAAAIRLTHGESRCYRARRGVVLSAGGFIFNRSMVKRYCKSYLPGFPLGTRADNGSGIRLGESVGGTTRHMGRVSAWRFINPPLAWSKGMIVNQQGARFVNESAYGATIGTTMVEQCDGRAWLIIDRRLMRSAWHQVVFGKLLPFQRQLTILNQVFGMRRFSGAESLCNHYGFDTDTFRSTLENYLGLAGGTVTDPSGKSSSDASALQPPFYVIDVSLAQPLLPCTVMTLGGLVVDEKTGEVLDKTRAPIAGLYAAGRTAVGIPSNMYMSGLSIADGVFAGRRAGAHAAIRDGDHFKRAQDDSSGAPGKP